MLSRHLCSCSRRYQTPTGVGTELGHGSAVKGSRNNAQPVVGSFAGTVPRFAGDPMAPVPFPSSAMRQLCYKQGLFKPTRGRSGLCPVGGYRNLIPTPSVLGLTLIPPRAAGPWERARIWPQRLLGSFSIDSCRSSFGSCVIPVSSTQVRTSSLISTAFLSKPNK